MELNKKQLQQVEAALKAKSSLTSGFNAELHEWAFKGDTLIGFYIKSGQVPAVPHVELSNILLVTTDKKLAQKCKKVGDIWWLDKSIGFCAMGKAIIPKAIEAEFSKKQDFVLMAEKVIDANHTQSDIRFKASIEEGQFKLESASGFSESGNYIIRSERLNQGLERIGAKFQVEFDDIEIDVLQG